MTCVDETCCGVIRLAALLCDTPYAVLTTRTGTRTHGHAHAQPSAGAVTPPSTYDPVTSHVLATPEPLVLGDVDADARFGPAGPGLRAYAGVPLTSVHGRVLGVLAVHDGEPRAFTPAQLEALELLARQAEQILREERAASLDAVVSLVRRAAESARLAMEVVALSLREVAGLVGVPAAGGLLLEPDGAGISLHVSWPAREVTAPVRGTSLSPLQNRVVDTAAAAREGSTVAFPLAHHNRVVGVVEFTGVTAVAEAELRAVMTPVGGILAHVVQRQRSAAESARREERLRRLIDLAGDAFVSTTPDGRILEWNKRAEALFGWSRTEVVGRSLGDVLVPADTAEHGDTLLRLLRARGPGVLGQAVEARALHRDGTGLTVELTSWATGSGDSLELNAFVRDIGHRLEVERLLRADLERKDRLVEELRGVDRMKNDVVTTVSHEFRTPLTSMLGYLELLVDDSAELDPLHQQALSAVHRNSHRLKRLVDNLVTVSRLDAGHGQLRLRELDLASLVTACLAPARDAAAAKGVVLRSALTTAPTLPGDPELLDRVLVNLLGNAVKFTPAGGEVRVGLSHGRTHAVLTVADTGLGIRADEIGAVFQRFYRGSVAEDQAIQGSGIGLAIVREVVEAHAGTVELVSEPGAGTTVTVRLPLAPQLPAQAQPADHEALRH